MRWDAGRSLDAIRLLRALVDQAKAASGREDDEEVVGHTVIATSAVAMAAVIGGMAGGAVGSVFTLLGGALGLLGERLLRRLGRVQCEIGDWTIIQRTSGAPEESQLVVTFWNWKEMPTAVWDVQVKFYKGTEPLEDWQHPALQFVDEGIRRSSAAPVNLPPRQAVARTLSLTAGREDKQRALTRKPPARPSPPPRTRGGWRAPPTPTSTCP